MLNFPFPFITSKLNYLIIPYQHSMPNQEYLETRIKGGERQAWVIIFFFFFFISKRQVCPHPTQVRPFGGSRCCETAMERCWDGTLHHILCLYLSPTYGEVTEQPHPGDGEGLGSLVCCRPSGCKESDTTEQLNNISL